jgi:hypothetical protein
MENIGQAALYFNGKVPTTYAAIGLGYCGGTGSENLPLAHKGLRPRGSNLSEYLLSALSRSIGHDLADRRKARHTHHDRV